MIDFRVDVPEYKGDTIRIEKFEVSQERAELYNLQLYYDGGPSRNVRAGTYTRLYVGDELMMSDTPAEIRENIVPIPFAKGEVLVNGLGLGVTVNGLLMRAEVDHVIVIELNPEVVQHVGGHYLAKYGSDRLTICNDDAFTWKSPKRAFYDYVYHDIWPLLSTANLPEYSKLLRRYGHKCFRQSAWMLDWLRREQRREKRYAY